MENESKKWDNAVNQILRARERNNGLLLITTPEWDNKIFIKGEKLNLFDLNASPEFLKIDPNSPSVYIFRVKTIQNEVLISRSRLQEISKKSNIKMAKVSKDIVVKNNDILYCGSVQKNLHYRFQQHLGFGSNQTYSLQLKYWMSQFPMDLEFSYMQFTSGFKDAVKLIESAMALTYTPAIGRFERRD